MLDKHEKLPDKQEKLVDWNIFTSLMLATWIRRFTKDNPAAKYQLQFVVEWIKNNRGQNGQWDMGISVKDRKI